MKGKDRQTVADVALVVSGSEETMFDLARLNGVSLDTEVSGLEMLEVPVLDQQVANYYKLNGIVPPNVLEEAISEEQEIQE